MNATIYLIGINYYYNTKNVNNISTMSLGRYLLKLLSLSFKNILNILKSV